MGVLYVVGYVIVNGYQTSYMSYSSNALQLKHLAAGALYAFLTLSEGLIMIVYTLEGFMDWAEWRDAHSQEKRKNKTNAVMAFVQIWGGAAFKALVFVGIVFGLIGVAILPTNSVRWSNLKGFLGWTAINLAVSFLLAHALYTFHRKRFETLLEKAFSPGNTSRDDTETSVGENENQTISAEALRDAKRTFIEAGVRNIPAVFGLGLLAVFSLVSFQGVYGRLKPDYGGGALYRVALHLDPQNRLPDGVREGLQAAGSSLLLVDRDNQFVYILRVDQSGAKKLFHIETSAIAALEVLQREPIHPDDAVFYLQHPDQDSQAR